LEPVPPPDLHFVYGAYQLSFELKADPDNPEAYFVAEAGIWNPTVLAELASQFKAEANEGVKQAVDADRYEMWHKRNDLWYILLYNKGKPVRATVRPVEQL